MHHLTGSTEIIFSSFHQVLMSARRLEQSATCRTREITVHVMSVLKPLGRGLPIVTVAR